MSELTHLERRKLKHLRRRRDHLRRQLEENGHYRGASYMASELSALTWVLKLLAPDIEQETE